MAADLTPVSVCGLGPMGAPIAEQIAATGRSLTVWNRTRTRAEAFAERGAIVAATPAHAATQVVLTVLPDLPEVAGIVEGKDGLLAGWSAAGIQRPILVIHGTTSPVATATFAQNMAERHDVVVLDAPLSGGIAGAATGTLSVMVGGDPDTARALVPLFETYGRVIRYFGSSGSGAMAKACNQIVVAATVVAISESLTLADTAGLDRAAVVEILEGGLAASEVLHQKKSKWLANEFSEGGSARNQLKDLRFIDDAARADGLELPATNAVRELFDRMVDRGDGGLDHTGIIRTIGAGRSRDDA